jgi:hypothetical protein
MGLRLISKFYLVAELIHIGYAIQRSDVAIKVYFPCVELFNILFNKMTNFPATTTS